MPQNLLDRIHFRQAERGYARINFYDEDKKLVHTIFLEEFTGRHDHTKAVEKLWTAEGNPVLLALTEDEKLVPKELTGIKSHPAGLGQPKVVWSIPVHSPNLTKYMEDAMESIRKTLEPKSLMGKKRSRRKFIIVDANNDDGSRIEWTHAEVVIGKESKFYDKKELAVPK